MAVALVTRLFWVVLGLAIAALAARIGIGSIDEPGAGMMSVGLGLLMAAIGLGSGARLLLGQSAPLPAQPWTRDMIVRIGGVIVLLMVYVALFERVGFLLTTFALMSVLLLTFAQLRWMWALTLAALLSVSNYALFKLLLGT